MPSLSAPPLAPMHPLYIATFLLSFFWHASYRHIEGGPPGLPDGPPKAQISEKRIALTPRRPCSCGAGARPLP